MLGIMFQTMITVAICWLLVVIGSLIIVAHCYKKVDQGQVLIRNGFGGIRISFSGIFVIPLIHNAEFLDITLKRLVIEQQGQQALTCKDGIRADVKAAFFIRINPTIEDVSKVVSKLGVSGAADLAILKEIYNERFINALKVVTGEHDYATLTNRELFKEEVMNSIGKDLEGFLLDVVAIDYLEKSKQ